MSLSNGSNDSDRATAKKTEKKLDFDLPPQEGGKWDGEEVAPSQPKVALYEQKESVNECIKSDDTSSIYIGVQVAHSDDYHTKWDYHGTVERIERIERTKGEVEYKVFVRWAERKGLPLEVDQHEPDEPRLL